MKDEPAFPVLLSDGVTWQMAQVTGLTKRELFAAMAMQGILASPWASTGKLARLGEAPLQGDSFTKLAVIHADALIAELEKK